MCIWRIRSQLRRAAVIEAIDWAERCPPKAKVTRSNRVGCANLFNDLVQGLAFVPQKRPTQRWKSNDIPLLRGPETACANRELGRTFSERGREFDPPWQNRPTL